MITIRSYYIHKFPLPPSCPPQPPEMTDYLLNPIYGAAAAQPSAIGEIVMIFLTRCSTSNFSVTKLRIMPGKSTLQRMAVWYRKENQQQPASQSDRRSTTFVCRGKRSNRTTTTNGQTNTANYDRCSPIKHIHTLYRRVKAHNFSFIYYLAGENSTKQPPSRCILLRPLHPLVPNNNKTTTTD